MVAPTRPSLAIVNDEAPAPTCTSDLCFRVSSVALDTLIIFSSYCCFTEAHPAFFGDSSGFPLLWLSSLMLICWLFSHRNTLHTKELMATGLLLGGTATFFFSDGLSTPTLEVTDAPALLQRASTRLTAAAVAASIATLGQEKAPSKSEKEYQNLLLHCRRSILEAGWLSEEELPPVGFEYQRFFSLIVFKLLRSDQPWPFPDSCVPEEIAALREEICSLTDEEASELLLYLFGKAEGDKRAKACFHKLGKVAFPLYQGKLGVLALPLLDPESGISATMTKLRRRYLAA